MFVFLSEMNEMNREKWKELIAVKEIEGCRQWAYLHGAEELTILVVALVFADQQIEFVDELTFDQSE